MKIWIKYIISVLCVAATCDFAILSGHKLDLSIGLLGGVLTLELLNYLDNLMK